jgi:hypothetical protein
MTTLSVRSKILMTTLSLTVFLLLLVSCEEQPGKPTEFVEYGWIEEVAVINDGITLYAKLDTGADNCSLDASNIEIYTKNKEERVAFTVRTRSGEEHRFDMPVRRQAKIKRVKGKTQVRPVVRLFLCLGEQYMNVDVNLVDRSNFAYPLLIGRSFLSGHAMVNPAKSFTADPQCALPAETD